MRVFVYGTLKQGGANHSVLQGARLEGPALLEGWRLYDLGPYPCVVEGPGTVSAEAYQISQSILPRLDALEGYPSLYNRRLVRDQTGREGWLYFMETLPPGAQRVASGRWEGQKGHSGKFL
jgi:gamma-glutamylcyclotransferase (GGCT)/AIG2-like uncharacterized protein YtfP